MQWTPAVVTYLVRSGPGQAGQALLTQVSHARRADRHGLPSARCYVCDPAARHDTTHEVCWACANDGSTGQGQQGKCQVVPPVLRKQGALHDGIVDRACSQKWLFSAGCMWQERASRWCFIFSFENTEASELPGPAMSQSSPGALRLKPRSKASHVTLVTVGAPSSHDTSVMFPVEALTSCTLPEWVPSGAAADSATT